jgi:hypothetical protein
MTYSTPMSLIPFPYPTRTIWKADVHDGNGR